MPTHELAVRAWVARGKLLEVDAKTLEDAAKRPLPEDLKP